MTTSMLLDLVTQKPINTTISNINIGNYDVISTAYRDNYGVICVPINLDNIGKKHHLRIELIYGNRLITFILDHLTSQQIE